MNGKSFLLTFVLFANLADAQRTPAPANRPDSVVLERSRCFYPCEYRLAVDAVGRTTRHNGNGSVTRDSASAAAFSRILATAARIGFDTMPEFAMGAPEYCRTVATDHATISVTIFTGQRLKQLRYYTGCVSEPPHLGRTERLIAQLRSLADTIDVAAGPRR